MGEEITSSINITKQKKWRLPANSKCVCVCCNKRDHFCLVVKITLAGKTDSCTRVGYCVGVCRGESAYVRIRKSTVCNVLCLNSGGLFFFLILLYSFMLLGFVFVDSMVH